MKPYQMSAVLMGALGGAVPSRFTKMPRSNKRRPFSDLASIKQISNPNYQDFPSRQMMRAALRTIAYMETADEFNIPRPARRRIARQKAKTEFKEYRKKLA